MEVDAGAPVGGQDGAAGAAQRCFEPRLLPRADLAPVGTCLEEGLYGRREGEGLDGRRVEGQKRRWRGAGINPEEGGKGVRRATCVEERT